MMTRCLAHELGRHGIRLNAIGPGYIDTELFQSMVVDGAGDDPVAQEAFREARRSQVALGRFGTPDDVARTALFLCSDESSYFTGSILHPDGGLHVDVRRRLIEMTSTVVRPRPLRGCGVRPRRHRVAERARRSPARSSSSSSCRAAGLTITFATNATALSVDALTSCSSHAASAAPTMRSSPAVRSSPARSPRSACSR